MSTTRSRLCVASASSSPPGSVASRPGDRRLRVTVIRGPGLTARQRKVIAAASLGRLLREAGDTLGVPARASLHVRLAGDEELQALNRRFLGVDDATDVLAFPSDERLSVGDVAISVERAMTQSSDPVAELRLLAVHGLLHCLGHDHAATVEAARMTDVTRSVLPHQEVPAL